MKYPLWQKRIVSKYAEDKNQCFWIFAIDETEMLYLKGENVSAFLYVNIGSLVVNIWPGITRGVIQKEPEWVIIHKPFITTLNAYCKTVPFISKPALQMSRQMHLKHPIHRQIKLVCTTAAGKVMSINRCQCWKSIRILVIGHNFILNVFISWMELISDKSSNTSEYKSDNSFEEMDAN